MILIFFTSYLSSFFVSIQLYVPVAFTIGTVYNCFAASCIGAGQCECSKQKCFIGLIIFKIKMGVKTKS